MSAATLRTTPAPAPAPGPQPPGAPRVAATTLVVLLPLFIVLFTAFKPAAEVNAYPPTLLPDAWTTANFERIVEDLPFARLIGNSFLFAGGVTLFAVTFDALAAYALARIDFRGRGLMLTVLIATLMIPFQATLIPVYQIVSDLGWVNTFAGLIAPRAADGAHHQPFEPDQRAGEHRIFDPCLDIRQLPRRHAAQPPEGHGIGVTAGQILFVAGPPCPAMRLEQPARDARPQQQQIGAGGGTEDTHRS